MGVVLLLADIHSNVRALDAVLRDAAALGAVTELWVLGDVVGYGAEPNECVERLRDFRCVCVAGNHDLGAVGRADLAVFNADARAACSWTGGRLSSASSSFLESLALSMQAPPFLLAHGSPASPAWEYVVSEARARQLAGVCPQQHCLVGHTHVPAAFAMDGPPAPGPCTDGAVLPLESGRFLINPGSVGQPRDGDPRASYAQVDLSGMTVRFRRVPYDVDGASASILREGLPPRLALRLHAGL